MLYHLGQVAEDADQLAWQSVHMNGHPIALTTLTQERLHGMTTACLHQRGCVHPGLKGVAHLNNQTHVHTITTTIVSMRMTTVWLV